MSVRPGGRKRFVGPRRRFRVLTISYVLNEPLTNAIIEEAGRFEWEIFDRRFLSGEAAVMRAFHADGVLCCQHEPTALLQTLAPSAVVVGYSAWYRPKDPVSVIEADHEGVGRLAAEHFLERGFRHLGCVNIPLAHGRRPHPTVAVRHGFERCLEAVGIRCLDPLILEEPTGREAFGAWLARQPRPLGVLVWQDGAAARISGWCRELGVAVPEEVALLGIGNNCPICKLSPCALSSVDTDADHQGREAVRLLQRMMLGEAVGPERMQVPPAGVITRKSTDILAVTDVVVAQALRFVWEHLAEPISIDDVAAAAGISRSTLERHFRHQVGRTVNEELLRKRLERCRELLLTTDLPLAAIAPLSGFFTQTYLHRAFRKRFGTSPSRYRRDHVR